MEQCAYKKFNYFGKICEECSGREIRNCYLEPDLLDLHLRDFHRLYDLDNGELEEVLTYEEN